MKWLESKMNLRNKVGIDRMGYRGREAWEAKRGSPEEEGNEAAASIDSPFYGPFSGYYSRGESTR
jgi:hypothetical protein